MFLRIIASKKVYFAQLLSQKTFYEFVKGKFSIIFISAGVKLPALKGKGRGFCLMAVLRSPVRKITIYIKLPSTPP
jgi:hypothetical protein